MPYTVSATPDYSAVTRGAEQLAEGIEKQKQMKNLKKAYSPFFAELGYSSPEEYENAGAGQVLPRIAAQHFKAGIEDLKRKKDADQALGNILGELRPGDQNRADQNESVNGRNGVPANLPPPPPLAAAPSLPPPPTFGDASVGGFIPGTMGAPSFPLFIPPPPPPPAQPSASAIAANLPPQTGNNGVPANLPPPQSSPRYAGGSDFADRLQQALANNPDAARSPHFATALNAIINAEHLREQRAARLGDLQQGALTGEFVTDPITGARFYSRGRTTLPSGQDASVQAAPPPQVKLPDGSIATKVGRDRWIVRDPANPEIKTEFVPVLDPTTKKPIPHLLINPNNPKAPPIDLHKGENWMETKTRLDAEEAAKTGSGTKSVAPAAPSDPGQRKAGQTYSTPRGNLKWTGTGWVEP